MCIRLRASEQEGVHSNCFALKGEQVVQQITLYVVQSRRRSVLVVGPLSTMLPSPMCSLAFRAT